MPEEVFDAIVTRAQRMLFLQILAAQKNQPSGDACSLQAMMSAMGSIIECDAYRDLIGYLSDSEKRFIRVDRRSINGVSITLITLTARGRDLLDGTLCDPGVGSDCDSGQD